MFYALAAVAILALLVWAGRRPIQTTNAVRLGSGALAGLCAVGAVVSGLRGAWMLSLALVGLSTWLGYRARAGVGAGASPRGGASGGMTQSEARSILGVGPEAGREEIEAAYRRLMQRAHPDRGGSPGLAAQLNAARDRLLKR
ncbi:MAG: molecular chaperone DnaJ [Caulobacteraceae bacterium]|nr:molecular chaperone DnaJ [Caulobacteraceae bacterium]